MNKKLLSLYGLKWNPFSPDVPTESLVVTGPIENFCWRVENLAREGGFALVSGEPGAGKSVALRILNDRLSGIRDLKVGILSRPQTGLADMYRELGDLFGVQLAAHNRWAGSKVLRERWQAHVDAALFRPVLIVDEAQEMIPIVLNELRLLCSTRLDSNQLLTTILGGDARLGGKLRTEDLLPLASRVRVRLTLERATPAELFERLVHALTKAGNANLMTDELMQTICEHATGNHRALMVMAGELLAAGAQRELTRLDEKLFLELFAAPQTPLAKAAASRRR